MIRKERSERNASLADVCKQSVQDIFPLIEHIICQIGSRLVISVTRTIAHVVIEQTAITIYTYHFEL